MGICRHCYNRAKGCAWTCKKMFNEIDFKICPVCDKTIKKDEDFLIIKKYKKERLIHRKCYETWDKL